MKPLQSLQQSAGEFARSVTADYSRWDWTAGSLLFLVTLASFIHLVPDALANGDAVVYAEQVQSADFTYRTVHIGYFLLGWLFSQAVPTGIDYSLNLMSALFGAGCVALVFALTLDITKDRVTGVLSGLAAATNFLIVENSIFAEVYVCQAFLIVLAIYLCIHGLPIATGSALGSSVLVSPSSIFAAPAIVVLRPFFGDLLRVAISASTILILVITPVWRNFFLGGRGLLGAVDSQMAVREVFMKESFEVLIGFGFALPVLSIGLWHAIRERSMRIFAIAVGLLWLVTFLFGERFGDVPVQLPTYVLLCTFVGIGFRKIVQPGEGQRSSETLRWLAVVTIVLFSLALLTVLAGYRVDAKSLMGLSDATLMACLSIVLGATGVLLLLRKRQEVAVLALVVGLLAANVAVTHALVQEKRADMIGFRQLALEASQFLSPSYILVASWSPGALFNHYVHGRAYTEHWLNPAWLRGERGEQKQSESWLKWRDSLAARSDVWLLEEVPELVEDLEDHNYEIMNFGQFSRAKHQPDLHDNKP